MLIPILDKTTPVSRVYSGYGTPNQDYIEANSVNAKKIIAALRIEEINRQLGAK